MNITLLPHIHNIEPDTNIGVYSNWNIVLLMLNAHTCLSFYCIHYIKIELLFICWHSNTTDTTHININDRL
jgi:hypothetical protein